MKNKFSKFTLVFGGVIVLVSPEVAGQTLIRECGIDEPTERMTSINAASSSSPTAITINLKLPDGVASEEPTPETEAAVKQTISKFKQSLSAKLPLSSQNQPSARPVPGVTITSEYSFIPAVEADVTKDGLNQLNLPDIQEQISCIEFPKMEQTQLRDSASQINASSFGPQRGNGMLVAVLDNGILSNHKFLKTQILEEKAACFREDSECPGKTKERFGKGAAESSRSHGTHVAGIVAGAQTLWNHKEISGVASGARVIPINVFSSTGSDTRDQKKALEYVIKLVRDEKLPIVAVNLSLGGGAYPNACDASEVSRTSLFKQLIALGIAPVVAAGNDGYSGKVSAPGCISHAITVSSVFKSDKLATDHNRSKLTDILAPGKYIYSSISQNIEKFGPMGGTSMATPHVAAAFAVARSALQPVKPSIEEMLTAFQQTGKPVEDGVTHEFYRRIDVKEAVRRLTARQLSIAALEELRDDEEVMTNSLSKGVPVLDQDGFEVATFFSKENEGNCRLDLGYEAEENITVLIPCRALLRQPEDSALYSQIPGEVLHNLSALQRSQ